MYLTEYIIFTIRQKTQMDWKTFLLVLCAFFGFLTIGEAKKRQASCVDNCKQLVGRFKKNGTFTSSQADAEMKIICQEDSQASRVMVRMDGWIN